METPEKFKNLAEAVRNEVYGKDVREAIATSIEKTGASSETAIKITEQLIDGSFDEAELTTEIERRLNQLEEEYAPELNSVKSQLAEIAQQVGTENQRERQSVWSEFGDRAINVKWFGAKGDGESNDTNALKECFSNVENGDTVIFPKGVYLLDSVIDGNDSVCLLNGKKDITIVGYGAKIKVDDLDVSQYGLSIFQGSQCENVTIEGFDIHYTTVNGVSDKDIRANIFRFNETNGQPCHNITIRNNRLHLYNPEGGTPGGSGGSDEDPSAYTKLTGLYFGGYYDSNDTNNLKQATNLTFENNVFYNTTARTLWCWFTDNVKIINNRFENSGSPFTLRLLVGNTNFKITGNYFSTPSDFGQPAIFGSRQSDIVKSENWVISNNIIKADNTGGIRLLDIEKCVIENNIIIGNDNHSRVGVEISGLNIVMTSNIIESFGHGGFQVNGEKLRIEGNTVNNCLYSGIALFTGENVQVNDNTCDKNELGIRISNQKKISVLNNTITDSIDAQILLAGSDNVKPIISGNYFFGGGHRTINALNYSVDMTTITNNQFLDNKSGQAIIRDEVVGYGNFAIVSNNVFDGNESSYYKEDETVVYNNVLNGELVDIPSA